MGNRREECNDAPGLQHRTAAGDVNRSAECSGTSRSEGRDRARAILFGQRRSQRGNLSAAPDAGEAQKPAGRQAHCELLREGRGLPPGRRLPADRRFSRPCRYRRPARLCAPAGMDGRPEGSGCGIPEGARRESQQRRCSPRSGPRTELAKVFRRFHRKLPEADRD